MHYIYNFFLCKEVCDFNNAKTKSKLFKRFKFEKKSKFKLDRIFPIAKYIY